MHDNNLKPQTVDCHFHYEPRMLSLSNVIQEMSQSQIDKVALMPSMIDPFPEPPSILINILQFLLKRKMLRPFAQHLCTNFSKKGRIQILFNRYSIYQKPDNNQVFSLVDQYPDKFYGWIFINPASDQDVESEISKWIDHPNCVGIKAHPFWHRYEPVALILAAKIAYKKEKPMLIHCGFNAHGNFLSLIKEVPELKLILAHAAFPGYYDCWRVIQSYPNIFVDLSQTSYVNKQTILDVVNTLGWQRCLFGTDGPYGSRDCNGTFRFDIIKSQIELLFPDMDCRQGILGKNFLNLANI
jgi:predicted TIM-barrel fold metal-dependent hydrolase